MGVARLTHRTATTDRHGEALRERVHCVEQRHATAASSLSPPVGFELDDPHTGITAWIASAVIRLTRLVPGEAMRLIVDGETPARRAMAAWVIPAASSRAR
jgi:hypothetical protein